MKNQFSRHFVVLQGQIDHNEQTVPGPNNTVRIDIDHLPDRS